MIKLQTDTGPTMASISDMDALKNYMPYNKLKLYPTSIVGIGKGHITQVCFQVAKYFFK